MISLIRCSLCKQVIHVKLHFLWSKVQTRGLCRCSSKPRDEFCETFIFVCFCGWSQTLFWIYIKEKFFAKKSSLLFVWICSWLSFEFPPVDSVKSLCVCEVNVFMNENRARHNEQSSRVVSAFRSWLVYSAFRLVAVLLAELCPTVPLLCTSTTRRTASCCPTWCPPKLRCAALTQSP